TKLEKGYKEPDNITMKEYFEQWLERKKRSVSAGTYEHYESYMKTHIIPGLGSIKLNKLESSHIESFMDEITAKDLSQRSKHHIYRILSSALLKGKKYGIKEDIMDDIDSPKVDKEEIEYWTSDEVQQFMGHLKSKNHDLPIVLALATGMRRGEILGLQWSKIDFDNKTISV